MDSIDESKALLLALGATALAGIVALMYSSQDVGKDSERSDAAAAKKEASKMKPKRVSKRQAATTRAAAATVSKRAGDGTKKKRRHKGKKRRSHKNRGSDTKPGAVVDPEDVHLNSYADDGSGAGWQTIGGGATADDNDKSEAAAAAKEEEEEKKDSADPEKKNKKTPASFKTIVNLGSCVSQVIGKGGRNIRAIESDSTARLNIDKRTNVCTITASAQDAVDRAKQLVLNAIEDATNRSSSSTAASRDGENVDDDASSKPQQFETVVDIGDKSGAVIGRAGSTIREIIAATGATLNVDKSRGDDAATVAIKAKDQESVDKAARMIRDVLAREAAEEADVSTLTMDLGSRHACVAVIGKGGSTVRDIQKKSGGARLDIKKESNVVNISGTKEQVEAARALVEALVAETSSKGVVKLTKGNVAIVIGKGGSTIRDVRTRSGARLDIVRDSRESDDVELHIVGSAKSVAEAKRLVEEILANPPKRGAKALAPGEIEYETDLGNAVGSVIGRGGSTIRRIRDESGAKVDVESGSSTCRISGTPEAVKSAREEVETILRDVAEREASRKKAAEGFAEDEEEEKKEGWAADAEGW